MDDIRPAILTDSPRLIGLSYETEKTYVHWTLRYIRFHHRRHPADLEASHVEQFLGDLAEHQQCSKATQRLALNALVFLYQRHLRIPLGQLDFQAARRKRRMPTVFNHEEAQAVIAHLTGTHKLVACLLYGSGLRISEALRLRIKDVDFGSRQITVRDGKGGNERATLLPCSVEEALEAQIREVERLHRYDLTRGYGEVWLPDALARKYAHAATSTAWQFLFPARQVSVDPRSGVIRRHHLHPTAVQRAVAAAIRASGFRRRASCHTFRHSFATRLVETGYDIKLVQSLLGHQDIRTTEIYLHVVRNRAGAIQSPVDL